MLAAMRENTWIERSERRVLKIGVRTALVKYKTPGGGTERSRIAQLCNISESGAQMISRLPMDAEIGTTVHLEFTLPGIQRRVFQKANVVRKINAFAFAVCFVRNSEGDASVVDQALAEFDRAQMQPIAPRPLKQANSWLKSQRQMMGIFVILTALAVFAALTLKGPPKEITVHKLDTQGQSSHLGAN